MGRGLFLLSQLHVYLIVDPLEPPVSCPTFLTEVILFQTKLFRYHLTVLIESAETVLF